MKPVRYVEKKVSLFSNKKFLTLLMGLFIISVMVFSVLYYGLDNSGQEKVEYKGLKFLETNIGWQAYTEENKRILILSDPRDLEEVSFDEVSLDFLKNMQKIYLSVNPSDDISSILYDFQRNVDFSGSYVAACYEESELCAELPIKSCLDASANTAVVIFKEAEEDFINIEGNCLTIQGKNLLILTDRLILDQYV